MSAPKGLFLSKDFLKEEKEQEIIKWLDSKVWSTKISRRTQHYGYEYNYNSFEILKTQPLEGPILDIANCLKDLGVIDAVQCIVNEYYRDQGIAPHVDARNFGDTIVGISLGADCTMTFSKDDEEFQLFLPRRSIMILSGDARYLWKHSIKKSVKYLNEKGELVNKSDDYRRISLTYRTLKN